MGLRLAITVLKSGGRQGARVEATPREEGGSGAEGRPGNLTGEPGALLAIVILSAYLKQK